MKLYSVEKISVKCLCDILRVSYSSRNITPELEEKNTRFNGGESSNRYTITSAAQRTKHLNPETYKQFQREALKCKSKAEKIKRHCTRKRSTTMTFANFWDRLQGAHLFTTFTTPWLPTHVSDLINIRLQRLATKQFLSFQTTKSHDHTSTWSTSARGHTVSANANTSRT